MKQIGASVALTGLKHVGKSAVGRLLARERGALFLDLDDLLVRRAEQERLPGFSTRLADDTPPVRSLFRQLGSVRFGEWEAEALREVPAIAGDRHVVLATGGGVCDRSESMELLSMMFTVLYLHNEHLLLYERSIRYGIPAFLDPDRPRDHFLEIADRRDRIYRLHADLTVDLRGCDIRQSTQRVTDVMREYYARQ